MRDEIRTPLKTHAWEATVMQAISVSLKPDREQNLISKPGSTLPQTILYQESSFFKLFINTFSNSFTLNLKLQIFTATQLVSCRS